MTRRLRVVESPQLPWRIELYGRAWLGPVELAIARPGATWRGGALEIERREGTDDEGPYEELRLLVADRPLPVLPALRRYRDGSLLVFRLEATGALDAIQTGAFAEPGVIWPALRPAEGEAPAGTRSFGHQYAEFALPVAGEADATGYTLAGHRPPVVFPLLWIAPDGTTLLLAPLDAFHEQIVRVPANPGERELGVRAGWHGDLAAIPAGFSSEMALFAAASPRAALARYGALLQRRAGCRRSSRYADDGVGKLSYWTDNGAVYYYRTEPGHDYTQTLARVAQELPAAGVPIRSLQLDSWFYPHEVLRAVSEQGAPVVPPTGMLRWEPRADLFADGFRGLRAKLGELPLTFHSRHFSKASPYCDDGVWWRDAAYAHPADPAFFDRFLASVAGWGGITYEQDWLVESFLGVRGLREAPGRARAWQEGLDRAAGEHGVTLQWCMGTPADWCRTVTLRNVTSVRTSGDYRYLFDNGLNWVWFLHGNAFARALGLWPYKDVFLTHGETALGPGEDYVEAESMLAVLSAGPVGIGDRLGHTDAAIVRRVCREDGVLVKPDVPLAAIDRCYHANAFFGPNPLIGECFSQHPAGRWAYVASFHASREKAPLAFRVACAELGESAPTGEVVSYDWRRRSFARVPVDGGYELVLAWQEFDLRVLCPLLPRGLTIVGDVEKYATAGDRRVARISATPDGVGFEVLGVAGERVVVTGWAARAPRAARAWSPDGVRALATGAAPAGDAEGLHFDPATGGFEVAVRLDAVGRASVSVVAG